MRTLPRHSRSFGIVVAGIVAAGVWWRSVPLDPPFDPYTDDYELSKEVQEHIWRIEQQVFTLANRTTPELARALRERDREVWVRSMTPGFEGAVFAGDGRVEMHGALTFTTWVAADPTGAVDGAALYDWLLEIRDRFAGKPTVKVHQEGLRPRSREALDGPFDATWTVGFSGRNLGVTASPRADPPRPTTAR